MRRPVLLAELPDLFVRLTFLDRDPRGEFRELRLELLKLLNTILVALDEDVAVELRIDLQREPC